MDSIGMHPGILMALLAGLSEAAGGILFVLGIFTPIAALLLAVPMLVAIITVTGKNGYWITNNGFEYNFLLISIAVSIALAGPGSISLHV